MVNLNDVAISQAVQRRETLFVDVEWLCLTDFGSYRLISIVHHDVRRQRSVRVTAGDRFRLSWSTAALEPSSMSV